MALSTNLISYWKLDESSGNAADSVGSNTLTNANVTYSTAKLNNGAVFNGTSSRLISSATTWFTNAFTVSLWAKPDLSDTSNRTFFCIRPTSGSANVVQTEGLSGGGVRVILQNSSGTTFKDYRTSVALSTSSFTHLVVTWDGTTLNIYQNAVIPSLTKTTDSAGTMTSTSREFRLGAESASSNFFDGTEDEVGIWSRALSADEISQLFNSGQANGYPLTDTPSGYKLGAGITSYWKLDESSGNAADSVGGFTLTNNNSVAYVAAKLNNGADFGSSNTNKNLKTTSNIGITATSAKSYAMWVKINTEPSSGTFYNMVMNCVGASGSAANFDYLAYENSGGTRRLVASLYGGTGQTTAVYNTTLGTSSYNFIVVTYASGTTGAQKIYLNGSLVATQNQTTTSTSSGQTLGFAIGSNTANVQYSSIIADEVGVWSRELSADEISQLFNSGRANGFPLTDTPSLYGCVAHYKLDESSGNAADTIGGKTLTNNNSVAYTAAKINNGADFESSSSQSLSISDASQRGLDFTTAFTIPLWIKFESLPATNTDMQWVAKWNAGASQRAYRFGLQNASGVTYMRLGVSSAGTATVEGSYAWSPTTGIWYHVAVTWNAGNYVFYINGSNVASGTTTGVTSLFNSTEPFYLGRSGDGAYFDGMEDEVPIFNRALSSTEISALYNSGAGLAYPWTASSSNIKSINGLAYSSVKSWNGLAKASIKSVNGLA